MTTRRVALLTLVSLAGMAIASTRLAAEVTAEKNEQGVQIKIDGQPFTEYLLRSGSKPILWPLLGPGGQKMTRSFPMSDEHADEAKDHRHHRSVWFTHGKVNGLDFWAEKKDPAEQPTIQHREFVTVESGPQAVIVTRNDWLAPGGKRVLEDERRLTFGGNSEVRWIDFDITLKASDGPVTFSDTKEGTMGIRVPCTVKVKANQGGKIVNSEGQTNDDAWGKRASWVDYYGPVDGQQVGVAMFNHPSSFRYPTPWHVRTYGLFAANPFGLHDFDNKPESKVDGTYVLPAGESLVLRYRIYLHKGDEKEGKVAEAYLDYAQQVK